jgi:hypothetical protein
MKKFKMIAPVVAFVFALGTAFAFTPPMTGFWRDVNGDCQQGDVTTPLNGQCPGGNKICQVGSNDAYTNCNITTQLKYN